MFFCVIYNVRTISHKRKWKYDAFAGDVILVIFHVTHRTYAHRIIYGIWDEGNDLQQGRKMYIYARILFIIFVERKDINSTDFLLYHKC